MLLALAAGMAAGCGSEEQQGAPIPTASAAELQKRLDSVRARFEFGGGACGDIPEDQTLANDTIAQLPAKVDPEVRQALQDGFDRLFTLTGEQCDETKGQETETDPDPLPDIETETQTETVPEPEAEPEPTTPTTPTTPTIPEEPPIDPVPPEGDPSGEEGSGGVLPPEDDG